MNSSENFDVMLDDLAEASNTVGFKINSENTKVMFN